MSMYRHVPPVYEQSDFNALLDDFSNWKNGFTPSGTFTSPYKFLILHSVSGGVDYYTACNAYQPVYGGTGNLGCDGTDAAAVVQKALDNLSAARTWKETVMLAGDFEFLRAVEVPDYTILDLAPSKITLADGANSSIFQNDDLVSGNTEIEFHGGILDGNMANQVTPTYGSGIYITKSSKIKILNTYITQCYFEGIHLYSENTHCWIKNGYFYQNGKTGPPGDAGYRGDGLLINDACTDIHVTDCVAKDNYRNGFTCDGSPGNECTDVLFENCYGEDNSAAFWLERTNYSGLVNCNAFHNQKAGAYAHAVTSFVLISAQYNTLTTCKCRGAAKAAFYLGDNHNSLVECESIGSAGSVAEGVGEVWIQDALNCTVNGGRFIGPVAGDLITFINSSGAVNGAICSTGTYGVRSTGTSDYISVNGCDLRGSITKALSLVGTHNKVGYDNKGYVNRNSGNGTGTGAQVVTAHGCDFTPTEDEVMLSQRFDADGDAHLDSGNPPTTDNIVIIATGGKTYNWLVAQKQ